MTAETEASAPGCTWCGRDLERETVEISPSDQTAMLRELVAIVAAGDQVDDQLRSWVGVLRANKVSWASIGGALGISRQAAWERFTRIRTGRRQAASSVDGLDLP